MWLVTTSETENANTIKWKHWNLWNWLECDEEHLNSYQLPVDFEWEWDIWSSGDVRHFVIFRSCSECHLRLPLLRFRNTNSTHVEIIICSMICIRCFYLFGMTLMPVSTQLLQPYQNYLYYEYAAAPWRNAKWKRSKRESETRIVLNMSFQFLGNKFVEYIRITCDLLIGVSM